jgi:hypothetical protein
MAKITVADLLSSSKKATVETAVQESDSRLDLALDLESAATRQQFQLDDDLMSSLKAALGTGVAVNAVLDARAQSRMSEEE